MGLGPDAGKWKNLTLATDRGAAFHIAVMMQNRAGADDGLITDVRISADDDICGQFRAGLNDGGRVDLLRHGLSRDRCCRRWRTSSQLSKRSDR